MITSTASDFFFIVTSIGFIVMFIGLTILLYYMIRAVRAFKELTEKIERSIEKNIDKVGYAGQELIDDMRHSTAFRFLFKARK